MREMTYKQESYINHLFTKKEYDMTPDVVYFTLTDSRMISMAEAGAVINYLESCPDKPEKTVDVQLIANYKKKIVRALNKKPEFGVDLRKSGVKFTYTNQYLYFLTEEGKVTPDKASEEQVKLFIEIAKKHVKGLTPKK